MKDISLNTLLNTKIYYYFHEIGYLPRSSQLFQELKNNILIDKLPEKITKKDIEEAYTNILVYEYICMHENIKKGSEQIQKCINKALKIAADMGDSDACYAISQFYHTITLNICYNIDETKTYNSLKNEFIKNKDLRYYKNIRKSSFYITKKIQNDTKVNNPNILWLNQNFRSDKLTNSEMKKLNYFSAKIDNIKKGILFTGNPEAELNYYLKYTTLKDTDLKIKLIISASRINFLKENPKFNIGSPNAQWILYNMMKKHVDLSKYGIDNSDTKLKKMLLESSIRFDQIENQKFFEKYTGSPNALQFYYDKIRHTNCPKKYKKIEKQIKSLIKKYNIDIR